MILRHAYDCEIAVDIVGLERELVVGLSARDPQRSMR
jgi:hypothetical protein